jgi:hypothetical protein
MTGTEVAVWVGTGLAALLTGMRSERALARRRREDPESPAELRGITRDRATEARAMGRDQAHEREMLAMNARAEAAHTRLDHLPCASHSERLVAMERDGQHRSEMIGRVEELVGKIDSKLDRLTDHVLARKGE